MANNANARRGVTLVEMIVVIMIIAILLGLLFPAVHFAREAARRAACQNNVHQLATAMQHFVELRKKPPDADPDGAIGGWAILILPFMEDATLADTLSGNPPLDVAAPPALAARRPPIMTCPSGYEGDSSVRTIPASHYSALFDRRAGVKEPTWELGELPTDSRTPWVASPELPFGGPRELMPHRGGYNHMRSYGSRSSGVEFVVVE
jgi:prepilin-type N-terminal cleavage/methylation domain-containing protein